MYCLRLNSAHQTPREVTLPDCQTAYPACYWLCVALWLTIRSCLDCRALHVIIGYTQPLTQHCNCGHSPCVELQGASSSAQEVLVDNTSPRLLDPERVRTWFGKNELVVDSLRPMISV
jgi:hypothetical protein